MRLLVAEDEADLAEVLGVLLERAHYTVEVVGDGQEALDRGLTEPFDGIILDIMIPRVDGMEVLRRLRAEGVTCPVMMLTAKGERRDRIAGFDAGADDYLPKPFSPDELLSRVRAMVRRRDSWQPPTLTMGQTTLDPSRATVSCRGESASLSRRELQVLEVLMEAGGRVVSSGDIIERVWGWDEEPEVNVVWVHLSNLRRKLKAIDSDLALSSVRGLGYRAEVAGGRTGR